MKSVFSILRPRSTSNNIQSLTLAIRSAHTAEEKIEIPKRIQRGPTDILRALESTIKRDPTAAHYKYHDDPYLIPMSNVGKRTFAMAQEAGRKAAHWIRAQHPELFQHREANPPIKAYFPKIVYDKDGDITEDNLKSAIDEVLVPDAVEIYKLCKERGVTLSDEVLTSFLELLCYYNEKEAISEEFIEERWFRQSSKGREKKRKTWSDAALAEEIFIGIDKPDNIAYSALIMGMAKYYQVERAWQLFQEAQEKGLILNVEAYNYLIRVSNFLKEGYELRWAFINEILTSMDKAKIKPNLRTLNAVLEALSMLGASKNTRSFVLQTLAEFKKLGIEPTLSSWYYVLITFCKERGSTSWILENILTEVENKEHKIRDLADTYFFVTAMDVCRNHLKDKELAKRVDKLLHHGNNYDLIGDSYKESIYYRHYFILLCQTEPLDVFMEQIYSKYVPNIYVPEPSVMIEILQAIELNSAIEYLPRIWSDMTVFDHTDREKLLESVLNVMTMNHPEDKPQLIESFARIGWDIFTKVENQHENRTQQITFTGAMLGSILTVLLRNNDFEKATTIMQKLDSEHQKVVGVAQLDDLKLYLEHAIKEKAPSNAIMCIQYASESGFQEAEDMARELNKLMTLDENHLRKLSKIVGDLFLQQNVEKEESSS